MASISKKSSNKVPIIFFQMLLAGRRTHNNRSLFLYGFEGVIMDLIMGSQNIMGSDYGSNISEDAFVLHDGTNGVIWNIIVIIRDGRLANRIVIVISTERRYVYQSGNETDVCALITSGLMERNETCTDSGNTNSSEYLSSEGIMRLLEVEQLRRWCMEKASESNVSLRSS